MRPDWPTLWALAYLAIPNLVFACGWLRPPFAALQCAAMLCLLCSAVDGKALPVLRATHHRWQSILVLLLASCVWAAFGGGSHFMYANLDWLVRDTVLADLIRSEWPVLYSTDDSGVLVLRTAFGYFLPLALFGKFFGFAQLDVAVYLWTALGVAVFFFLLPLAETKGWRLLTAVITAIFFSGMDFLGALLASGSLPVFPLRLEWWTPLSYPSLTQQLLWAPNHCLPIWIATLLHFRHQNTQSWVSVSVATLALSLIWTPFALLGLLPFALLQAIRFLSGFGWQRVPWAALSAGVVFALPVIAFLSLNAEQIQFATATTAAAAAAAGPEAMPFQAVSFHSYATFVSCEFLLLAFVLAPHAKTRQQDFWLAVGILLLLPMVRFGPSNDFGLRLSTPPLIVLLLVCIETIVVVRRATFRCTTGLAAVFLVIGAHTALNELWRAAAFSRIPPNYAKSLPDHQAGKPAAHYAGRLDTSPLQYWLRPQTLRQH